MTYDGDAALFYSPAHYVPVPDASLPEGMTRDALLSQIVLWRPAALAPDA
ncbi:hypothetical protein [uncultured Maritimibacter sp.]|nr:hypothetical protein [uncultured Maritimibacter sp.]